MLAMGLVFGMAVTGCGNVSGGEFYNQTTLAGKLESLAPNTPAP
jgi:hypothetical protein